MVSPDNNIADEFKSQVITKLIEYLSEDTSSLTAVENLDLANNLIFTDVVNEVVKNISSIETDYNQTPIYDLSGKAVTGDLQKDQIYIQNGKKVVVQ